jgi:hypothetical protein
VSGPIAGQSRANRGPIAGQSRADRVHAAIAAARVDPSMISRNFPAARACLALQHIFTFPSSTQSAGILTVRGISAFVRNVSSDKIVHRSK